MNEDKHLNTWKTYQSAWAPISDAERRELLRQSVSDDIVYTDPVSQVHGVDALAERIGKVSNSFQTPASATIASSSTMARACFNGRC